MSESAHTPGPWSRGNNQKSLYGCEIIANTKIKSKRVVCRLGGPDREENATAIINAVNTYPAVAELVEALELAEQLYQVGLLSAPDNLADDVVKARRTALRRFHELEGKS
jgi:hypothetical protein